MEEEENTFNSIEEVEEETNICLSCYNQLQQIKLNFKTFIDDAVNNTIKDYKK